jgi:Flp pilus assembly protein TadD
MSANVKSFPCPGANSGLERSWRKFGLCRLNLLLTLSVLLVFAAQGTVFAQGNITLWGDVKVDETKVDTKKSLSLSIILYNLAGSVLGRQTVPSGSRYRFNNVRAGEYDIGIEVETTEIARVHVVVGGSAGSDFRQDLEFEWKPSREEKVPKAGTISAADAYKRSASNEALFQKAQAAVDKKKYDDAVNLFKQIADNDNQDFQAWTELGTAYLLREKKSEAEQAYLKAVEVRSTFVLALLNLGRLRVSEKKFAEAIGPLSKVVEVQPESAEANYLLGESYLQTKQGSKAVTYLTEAAKLGKADAHLRLATLYNAVGMKDKAVLEYEEFLKKKPDFADRKKLEQYIEANKSKPLVKQ